MEQLEEEIAEELYQLGSAAISYNEYNFLASPLFVRWMNSLNYTVYFDEVVVRVEIGTPSLLAVVEDV